MSKAYRTTECCPACESTRFTARMTKEPTYRCNVCRERFETPAERRDKRHTSAGGGHAQATTHDAYAAVVPALRGLVADGQRYIKASHVSARVEYGPSYVGSLLKEIGLERGDVTIWSANGNQNVWHIELDARPEVAADD